MTPKPRTERDVLVDYAVDCIANDTLWMKLMDRAEDGEYFRFREDVFDHTRDRPVGLPGSSYPKRRLATMLWRMATHVTPDMLKQDLDRVGGWHLNDMAALRQRNPIGFSTKPASLNPSNSESETMNDNAKAATAGTYAYAPCPTPIQHITLVFGHDVTKQSEDALVATIEHIEAGIAKVQALASKSKYLTKRVADLKAALKAVTDELDSRT